MASFQKRGKTWQYTISNVVDGKSKPIRKSGFRTKPEAVAAALEIEMSLSKGGNVVVKDRSFVDYFTNWIEVFKKNRHYTTYNRYINSLDSVKEYFADKPIQKITRQNYQSFINAYGTGKSKETVRKLNTHVRACVKDAVLDGLILHDFTQKIELHFTVKAKKETDKYLDFEESRKLYTYLLEHLESKNLSYYMLLLALTTGARYGELVGITDNDFDFENNILDINKTWRYKKDDKNEFGDLKADSKPRKVAVDEDVMLVFKELLSTLPERPHNLVFYSSASKKMVVTGNAVNKALNNVLDSLELDKVTIHALRHTHASSLLFAGATIQYVSERLGHADIATTYNTYTHVLKELKEKDENIALNLYKKESINESENV